MVENNAASDAHQLAKELKEIRTEWLAIRTRYMDDGPDLDIPGYGEEWLEAITVGHQPRFPKAFHDARWQVLVLMCDRFAPWAHRVVNYFGIKVFPITCSNPSFPKHPADINNPDSRSRLLTGTDNTIEAGKRMILWGSAYASPASDQTDKHLRDFFPEWSREFVSWGDHFCRPIEEPMEWVASAFDELCRDATPDEPLVNPTAAGSVARTTDPNKFEETAKEGLLAARRPLGFTTANSDVVQASSGHGKLPTIPLELLEQIPGNEDTMKVLAIVVMQNLTVDEKLRALAKIDKRYFGFTSQKLGELLNVSRQAVEKTDWWRIDKKKENDEAASQRRIDEK